MLKSIFGWAWKIALVLLALYFVGGSVVEKVSAGVSFPEVSPLAMVGWLFVIVVGAVLAVWIFFMIFNSVSGGGTPSGASGGKTTSLFSGLSSFSIGGGSGTTSRFLLPAGCGILVALALQLVVRGGIMKESVSEIFLDQQTWYFVFTIAIVSGAFSHKDILGRATNGGFIAGCIFSVCAVMLFFTALDTGDFSTKESFPNRVVHAQTRTTTTHQTTTQQPMVHMVSTGGSKIITIKHPYHLDVDRPLIIYPKGKPEAMLVLDGDRVYFPNDWKMILNDPHKALSETNSIKIGRVNTGERDSGFDYPCELVCVAVYRDVTVSVRKW